MEKTQKNCKIKRFWRIFLNNFNPSYYIRNEKEKLEMKWKKGRMTCVFSCPSR